MKFAIQVSKPRININRESLIDIESIRELIEEIFPMYTEDMILIWDCVRIPLEYKYDISVIIDEILDLLQTLLDKEEGEMLIVWPSDTFRSNWNLKWKGHSLCIDSEWISVVGLTEEILNKHKRIEISTNEFLAEWKMLLRLLIGIFNENDLLKYNFNEFRIMQSLIDRIPGIGKLYIESF